MHAAVLGGLRLQAICQNLEEYCINVLVTPTPTDRFEISCRQHRPRLPCKTCDGTAYDIRLTLAQCVP